MSIGGLLLGAFFGAVLSFTMTGPLWLFGRLGYVLPAVFGVAGAVGVPRLPGRRVFAAAGYLAGVVTFVLGLLLAAAFCWWIVHILANKHGWF
ncbi:MAG TPA: hypothetical protein VE620_06020 [Myxococcales bacterium]|jgi:hypothetical protein|nr:hypothetical protein [Myxococcales bacterium]